METCVEMIDAIKVHLQSITKVTISSLEQYDNDDTDNGTLQTVRTNEYAMSMMNNFFSRQI